LHHYDYYNGKFVDLQEGREKKRKNICRKKQMFFGDFAQKGRKYDIKTSRKKGTKGGKRDRKQRKTKNKIKDWEISLRELSPKTNEQRRW
jgi:hypothetical protein